MTVGPDYTTLLDGHKPAPLPEVVRAYAARALQSSLPRRVRIEQQGSLRLSPTGRWKHFTAVQEYAAERSFFEWRARVAMAPGVHIRVTEKLDDDVGTLEVHLFNMRTQHAEGPEVTSAQQIRYLSEIIWNPGAITLHPGLRWRDLSGRRILLSCRSHQPDAHVEVHFDGHGDPACVTAMRPRIDRALSALVGTCFQTDPAGGSIQAWRASVYCAGS
jgi:hypothetical protein